MNSTQIKALANVICKKVEDIKKEKNEIEKQKYYEEFIIDLEKELKIVNQILSNPKVHCISYDFFGYRPYNISIPNVFSKADNERAFNHWLKNVKKIDISFKTPTVDDIRNTLIIESIERDTTVSIEAWIEKMTEKFI